MSELVAWSKSKLALELRRDRRTIDRAVTYGQIEPAGKRANALLYRLHDVIAALYEGDEYQRGYDEGCRALAAFLEIGLEQLLEQLPLAADDSEAQRTALAWLIEHLLVELNDGEMPPLENATHEQLDALLKSLTKDKASVEEALSALEEQEESE